MPPTHRMTPASRRSPVVALGACLTALSPLQVEAQGPSGAAASAASPAAARLPISAAEIDGHLRFLSSDLLEGRAPATRGGRLAGEYIASQLRGAGVEPGVNGSYLQAVPIDVVGEDPATIRAAASGESTATLRYPDDVVVWAGS